MQKDMEALENEELEDEDLEGDEDLEQEDDDDIDDVVAPHYCNKCGDLVKVANGLCENCV